MEIKGTFECPVCGDTVPHEHLANADRRWERLKAERSALLVLLSDVMGFVPTDFHILHRRFRELSKVGIDTLSRL